MLILLFEFCINFYNFFFSIAPYSTGKVKQLKSFESEKEMEYELNHQSLKSFHSALSTNPGSVRILRNIAMSYQNLNQHQEALSYFQRGKK